jgi:hypothetical protein
MDTKGVYALSYLEYALRRFESLCSSMHQSFQPLKLYAYALIRIGKCRSRGIRALGWVRTFRELEAIKMGYLYSLRQLKRH